MAEKKNIKDAKEHYNTILEERVIYNLKIIELLKDYLSKYEDLRFEQAVYDLLGGNLDFNRESRMTFQQMQTVVKK